MLSLLGENVKEFHSRSDRGEKNCLLELLYLEDAGSNDPSNRREMFIQRQSVTPLTIRVFSSPAVSTSNLAQ
jgi:hypothetical protein